MMLRKAIIGCLSLAALGGCATTSTSQTTSAPTQQVRRRPRRRDVQRVLGEAVRRAAECLPRAAPNVTVTGAFHGERGEFSVENIESETPLGTTVRTCVREEFEAAHVEPFADARFEAVRVFTAEGTTIAAQSGSATTTSAAPANTASVAASSAPPDVPTGAGTNATNAVVSANTNVAPNTTAAANATPETGTTNVAVNPATTASVAPPNTGTSTSTSSAAANAAVRPGDVGPLPTSVIANCYTSILRMNPSIGGRLRLQFEITPDGAARNVTATAMGTPTGPAALFANAARCVEQRVRAHSFARSTSGRADLVVAMTPSARGGNVSIQQRAGGLLAVAPGLETAATTTASASPETTAASAAPAGNWNDVSGTSAFNRQIADSVRARVGEIRACYQGQLARSPDLALRTRVRFTIEAAGTVPAASSTTVVTAGDADSASAVAQCVEGVVRGTSFPARAGATSMETSLPFTFSPGPGTTATSTPAATASASTVAPTGRIDPNATSMVIRQHTDQVRACYTRALRVNPALAGRVLVRFVVDPSGHVVSPSSQITALGGDRNAFAGVASCIEQVLQSVMLPPPAGGAAAVALPFDFTPNTP